MKKNYPTHIITHHSNGTLANKCASTVHQNVVDIDSWHRKRWPGFTSKKFRIHNTGALYHVGYHLVTNLRTGVTTQTRGFDEEGAHCIGKNTSSIGWLFIGNYTRCSPDRLDEEVAKKEFLAKAPSIMKEFNIPIQNIVPHRYYANKDCHGDQLADGYFQEFIREEKKVSELKEVSPDVLELKEKVVLLEDLVQKLQRLVIMLINMLSSKRLAMREKNNNKTV